MEEQHVDTSRERGGGARKGAESEGQREGVRARKGAERCALGSRAGGGGHALPRGVGGGSFGITADSAEASAKVASVEQVLVVESLIY